MKPDRVPHVTMTFSKATRLFSRWSNSGKSFSFSCDSRAVSSAEEPGLRGNSTSLTVCVTTLISMSGIVTVN